MAEIKKSNNNIKARDEPTGIKKNTVSNSIKAGTSKIRTAQTKAEKAKEAVEKSKDAAATKTDNPEGEAVNNIKVATVTTTATASATVVGNATHLPRNTVRAVKRHNVRKQAAINKKVAKIDLKVAKEKGKATIRTAHTQAKLKKASAKATAKTSREAAQKSYEITKETAKVTIKVGKEVAKATAKTIKAIVDEIIASFSVLAALIGVGGSVACVILIGIIALMLVCGSTLGIIFNEEGNGDYTLDSAMVSINKEFSDKIKAIEDSNDHNEVIISNDGCTYTVANWADIIAVWDVKINSVDGEDVMTINEAKFQKLREVVWDMVSISYKVVTESSTTTTPKNENDEKTTQAVKRKKLYISVDYKTADEMTASYSFTTEQLNSVNELLVTPEFTNLFVNIAGSTGGTITGSTGNGTGQLTYPTDSRTVSAGYPNYSNGTYHGGVDFPVASGSNVYAAADGKVILVKYLDYSYGYYVMIDHGDGLSTLYAHNSQILVELGDTVKQGQIIAKSGSTGNSTGPHCHFEVRVNGTRVSPYDYLS